MLGILIRETDLQPVSLPKAAPLAEYETTPIPVSAMATSQTVSTVNFIQLQDKSTGMQFLVDNREALVPA